jgi:CheY-like chemotaxis protein
MSQLKILIVDDEPTIVNTVRAYLEPEGHTVYAASDGLGDALPVRRSRR